MGLEIRLGRDDHKVTDEFISSEPVGIDAFIVDANHLRRHSVVIDAARAKGIGVLVEPLTERLVELGFRGGNLDYWDALPIDPFEFTKPSKQVELVERVVGPQIEHATPSSHLTFTRNRTASSRLTKNSLE
ncbi:MAG: hypothetical protein WEB52_01740 [Dehalococcoidia bacterium]